MKPTNPGKVMSVRHSTTQIPRSPAVSSNNIASASQKAGQPTAVDNGSYTQEASIASSYAPIYGGSVAASSRSVKDCSAGFNQPQTPSNDPNLKGKRPGGIQESRREPSNIPEDLQSGPGHQLSGNVNWEEGQRKSLYDLINIAHTRLPSPHRSQLLNLLKTNQPTNQTRVLSDEKAMESLRQMIGMSSNTPENRNASPATSLTPMTGTVESSSIRLVGKAGRPLADPILGTRQTSSVRLVDKNDAGRVLKGKFTEVIPATYYPQNRPHRADMATGKAEIAMSRYT